MTVTEAEKDSLELVAKLYEISVSALLRDYTFAWAMIEADRIRKQHRGEAA